MRVSLFVYFSQETVPGPSNRQPSEPTQRAGQQLSISGELLALSPILPHLANHDPHPSSPHYHHHTHTYPLYTEDPRLNGLLTQVHPVFGQHFTPSHECSWVPGRSSLFLPGRGQASLFPLIITSQMGCHFLI